MESHLELIKMFFFPWRWYRINCSIFRQQNIQMPKPGNPKGIKRTFIHTSWSSNKVALFDYAQVKSGPLTGFGSNYMKVKVADPNC